MTHFDFGSRLQGWTVWTGWSIMLSELTVACGFYERRRKVGVTQLWCLYVYHTTNRIFALYDYHKNNLRGYVVKLNEFFLRGMVIFVKAFLMLSIMEISTFLLCIPQNPQSHFWLYLCNQETFWLKIWYIFILVNLLLM